MQALVRSTFRASRLTSNAPPPWRTALSQQPPPTSPSPTRRLPTAPKPRHVTTLITTQPTKTRALQFATDILQLSKYRLSALVVLTASTGYICRYQPDDVPPKPIHPAATHTPAPSFYHGLLATTAGTYLTAASANTLNQIYETHSDRAMARTRLRPLPSGRITRPIAALFAFTTAATGLTILHHACNHTAAGIAALNLLLYAACYTPLKAISTINTAVGAIVGALPPLIGWTAASSGKLSGERERGAWWLAALLCFWQIPHFHALAMNLRTDYARAGLKMLAVSNPPANARTATLCAAALLPLGAGLHSAGVTDEAFAWAFAAASAVMLQAALRLDRQPTSVPLARKLFRVSICHLPLSLALLVVSRVPYGHSQQMVQRPDAQHLPRQVCLHQPWDLIAPFPFLPVPRPPAIVLEERVNGQ